MYNKSDIELKVAEFLLQIKAIKLQPNQPFTWASGWKSPIYCDNRITLSHPSVRDIYPSKACSAYSRGVWCS
jgi:orotate phosphoribosyltransferase